MSTDDDNDDMWGKYWTQLLGQAESILIGVSDALMQSTLFNVLLEFFSDSNCWQEAIGFTVVPTTLYYVLIPVSGRILRLWAVTDQNNVPQAAVMPIPDGNLHFLYPYTSPQPMTAIFVKTVSDPQNCFPPHIPEWLLPTYGFAILQGLLGSLMIQPDQSWTDKENGVYRLKKFRDLTMAARVAMMRANTVGVQSWAYPQSYRTFNQRGAVSTFNVNTSPQTLR